MFKTKNICLKQKNIFFVLKKTTVFFQPWQKPDIPEPPKHLCEQLMDCQKLNKPSWNRVHYIDTENKFKHTTPFQPLLANYSLACSNQNADFNLCKMERMLGTISYGLLAQREAFQQARCLFGKTIPEAADLLTHLFTTETSDFKSSLVNLLQYMCGKKLK